LNKGFIGGKTRIGGADENDDAQCSEIGGWQCPPARQLNQCWREDMKLLCRKTCSYCGACNVKTIDGKCCSFPFLYKGIERNKCVKGITTDRKWCGTTYSYDQYKEWGWCPSEDECSVKTEDGKCCKFPFLYKGINRNECIKGITTNRKWCGTTYNYDQEKKWGWCPSRG